LSTVEKWVGKESATQSSRPESAISRTLDLISSISSSAKIRALDRSRSKRPRSISDSQKKDRGYARKGLAEID
jgi:hypothetical protein